MSIWWLIVSAMIPTYSTGVQGPNNGDKVELDHLCAKTLFAHHREALDDEQHLLHPPRLHEDVSYLQKRCHWWWRLLELL